MEKLSGAKFKNFKLKLVSRMYLIQLLLLCQINTQTRSSSKLT